MKDIKKFKKGDFLSYASAKSYVENTPDLLEDIKKWKLKDLREYFDFTHMNIKTGEKLKAIEGVNCMDCFSIMRNDEHSSINKNYCRECL